MEITRISIDQLEAGIGWEISGMSCYTNHLLEVSLHLQYGSDTMSGWGNNEHKILIKSKIIHWKLGRHIALLLRLTFCVVTKWRVSCE